MLALIASLQLAAAASAPLAAAEAACYQLDYARCLDSLQKAKAVTGNPRNTLLRILELEGVTAAQTKQVLRAQDALRTLFLLDRDHKFSGSFSPRVNTEILEAKAWAKASGGLVVTALEPTMTPGAVESVGLVIEHNPLGLARVVRVHQRTSGGEATAVDVAASGDRIVVPAKGPLVEWWVEVLGVNESVLLELGSEKAPLVARAPEVRVADAPVQRELAPVAAAVPERIEEAPAPVGPRFRPAAWTTLVLGIVLAGAGAYFAASSVGARSALEHPSLDSNGLVMGRTQAETQALDGRMQRDAWLANGLFAGGGALSLTGIILFIVGRGE